MTAIQIHLLLNHVPVFGTLLGLIILAVGILSKNDTVNKVAFYILTGTAILVVHVYFSGDNAEESLKQYGIGREQIKPHDQSSKLASVAVLFTGILSGASLLKTSKGKSSARAFSVATLLTGLVAAGLIIYTARLGGQIRHPEIDGSIDKVKVNTF